MYLEYFETTADDVMESCHWDRPLKEKMRQPVADHEPRTFDAGRARLMIELAWFDDPHRPVEVFVWDEAAKAKMREPVRTNGYHHLDPDILVRNLFSSLY